MVSAPAPVPSPASVARVRRWAVELLEAHPATVYSAADLVAAAASAGLGTTEADVVKAMIRAEIDDRVVSLRSAASIHLYLATPRFRPAPTDAYGAAVTPPAPPAPDLDADVRATVAELLQGAREATAPDEQAFLADAAGRLLAQLGALPEGRA